MKQLTEAQVNWLLDARSRGEIGLVPSRILVGTATVRERLAYRFPQLCGWLNRAAATERRTGVHPWDDVWRKPS